MLGYDRADGVYVTDSKSKPQGYLVAIGGNEDKEKDLKVLRHIVGLPVGGTRIVELIPLASRIPHEVVEAYIPALAKIGVEEVRIMHIESRADANRQDYVDRILASDVVFFTGGDQLRITSLLGGSPVMEAINGHYWRGGVVAGTSAGAAAMSGTMIFEGDVARSVRKGSVHMVPGVGLLQHAIIDTHFIQRGRITRLLEVIASNPGSIGLGLGEDTGIVIREGEVVEVIGSGVVVVVDGHQVRYSNVYEIDLGDPIAVENVVLHTLVAGHRYDLANKLYLPPGTHRPTPNPRG